MLIPAPLGSVWDARLLEVIASSVTGIGLWLQTRARQAADPVADLTARLRHPIRWSIRHPFRAFQRAAERPTEASQIELYYPQAFTEWAMWVKGEFYTLSYEERRALYSTWRLWECPEAPSLEDREAVAKILGDLHD